ncbi:MAG TPA: hypothetical protein PKN93_17915, partial [Leptospiraceae bacterium]|nr:hypothetical protein [Leptospiraceae bacterium]
QALTIKVREDGPGFILEWTGKSNEREPGKFITPILTEIMEKAGQNPVVLDFGNLEYMNSSTITPIIRILDTAKKNKQKIKILYKKALKWQDLSFSALTIFKTEDGQISIEGV